MRKVEETRKSDLVIGGTLALTLAWNGTCSLLAPGWVGAALITGINWTIFLAYLALTRNRLVARLLLLAAVAGWIELLADRWLVEATETLVYHPGGPFVLASPLYMPFAWGVVLTQTAYIGWRLRGKLGTVPAALTTGLVGAATIPLYEWWAKGALWWYYRGARMWGAVPLYIILGEFLLAGALVPLTVRIEERSLGMAALLGVAAGLWIWGSYAVALAVTG